MTKIGNKAYETSGINVPELQAATCDTFLCPLSTVLPHEHSISIDDGIDLPEAQRSTFYPIEKRQNICVEEFMNNVASALQVKHFGETELHIGTCFGPIKIEECIEVEIGESGVPILPHPIGASWSKKSADNGVMHGVDLPR